MRLRFVGHAQGFRRTALELLHRRKSDFRIKYRKFFPDFGIGQIASRLAFELIQPDLLVQ